MRRPRIPTTAEAALWRHYVRDVAPLHDQPEEPPAVPAPPPPVVLVPAPPPSPLPIPIPIPPGPKARQPAPSRRIEASGPVDLDRRTWQRLRRGEMVVEARLDLHGLTQEVAYDRLNGFLHHSYQVGLRCVLVITGRGSGDSGVLRMMTPRWLDTPPMAERVLSYAQAKLHHGGAGALYVLIPRRRTPPGR